MPFPRIPAGMRVFSLVWLGQSVSFLGSAMTQFALALWIYQRTGSTLQLGLSVLFPELVILGLSPFAGALIDRWDRRKAMIFSDGGAGICTVAIAGLLWTGNLELWHLYAAITVSTVFTTFQWPAYAAATTLLVDKEQYGRANGMVQLSEGVGQLLAPVIAGGLFAIVGIEGIMAFDVLTFLFAVGSLCLVRFPALPRERAAPAEAPSLLAEARYGWRYIVRRPGLLALLGFLALVNFNLAMTQLLITPLVLGFASASTLGIVLSFSGTGMIAGGAVMSAWGGPKRRILGVLGFGLLQGLVLLLGGLQPNAYLVAGAAFALYFGLPILAGSNQAIWQSKVEPGVQGRVFAMRSAIANLCRPLAYFLAGPLVDYAFEPWLAPGGALSGSVGRVIGTGRGRGTGLLFVVLGILTITGTLVAYLNPRMRLVEDELPDADAAPEAADAPAEIQGAYLPAVEP